MSSSSVDKRLSVVNKSTRSSNASGQQISVNDSADSQPDNGTVQDTDAERLDENLSMEEPLTMRELDLEI
jgi:hypothetical protein